MMRYRVHRWVDTKSLTPMYGVQAQFPGERTWMHVSENGKAVLFDREAQADAYIERLRENARQRASQPA